LLFVQRKQGKTKQNIKNENKKIFKRNKNKLLLNRSIHLADLLLIVLEQLGSLVLEGRGYESSLGSPELRIQVNANDVLVSLELALSSHGIEVLLDLLLEIFVFAQTRRAVRRLKVVLDFNVVGLGPS
jgi:hypothetical protein